MVTFNSNKFIKSLKERYDAIPYIQGDSAAKVMVADSIKSNGFNPEDAYSFISKKMGLSDTLSDGEWKKIIEAAIKRCDFFGQSLKEFKESLKGKLSYQEMFNLAAACCGINPALLTQELCLNKIDWTKVVETLIKAPAASKVETLAVKPTAIKEHKKVEKKTPATKSSKGIHMCKPIPLVCERTGEVKT